MRILVTGATGFVGRRLLPRLAALGHDALALPRGRGAPADLAEIGAWPCWPPGVEAVIHLAALNPSRREAAARDAPRLHRANADGTRALAERAAAEGVRRLVYLSSASVHAAGEAPARETDAPAPQTPYAASKLAGEQALQEVAARTGLSAAILRPPPIHGPGTRNAVAALARLARLPVPLPLDQPALKRSVVGIENMISAILLALDHPDAGDGPFLVADGPPLSVGEMVAIMRRSLGRRPGLLPLPRLALAALPGARLTPLIVEDARIRARLGWRPPQSPEEALAATVRGEPA